jgi:hypothetical protein
MSQTIKVVAVSLAAFAVYLPIAFLVGRDFVPAPTPAGKVVEMMRTFDIDKPDRYVVRSYIFGPSKYPDTSIINVYEGMTPLSRAGLQFTPDGQAYVIRFKTSDGTDPRTNGRNYWLVLP